VEADTGVRVPGPRLLLVLTVAVAAAGCGARSSQSEPTGDGGVVATSAASATRSAEPTDAAALDPCALLDATDRSTAGLSALGEPTTVAGSRACEYVQPGAFGVTVTVDERTDLDTVRSRAAHVEDVRIGALDAVRIADPAADDGTCSVTVAVGRPGARSVHVDVTTTDFRDTAQACTRATTVAELIEPELT
jgi:hypothetical protein